MPIRTGRYVERLDAKLATLHSNEERQAFLKRDLARWELLYSDFQRGAALQGASPSGASAEDYLMTILAIGQRMKQQEVA